MPQEPKPARSLPPHGAIVLAGFVAAQGLLLAYFALWNAARSGVFESDRLSLASKIDAAAPGVVGVVEVIAALAIFAGVRRAIVWTAWVEAVAGVVAATRILTTDETRLALGLAATHAVTALLLALVARSARHGGVPVVPWRIATLGLEVVVAITCIVAGGTLWVNAFRDRPPPRPEPVVAAAADLGRDPFLIVLPATDGPSRAAWQSGPRLTVVNFWATWCGPCVQELPALARFAANHDPADVAVVLIETSRADSVAVRSLLAKRAPGLACLRDAEAGVWPDVARALGRQAIPTTIVLDSEGQPVARWQGERSAAEVEREIEKALAGSR